MTDNRDDAEFLDGDALGEEVGDQGLPGTDGFPPDLPWGVEDPTGDDVDDDLAAREERIDHTRHTASTSFSLVNVGSSEGLMNDESQEIASTVDAIESDLSPEDGAMHIVESP